MEPRFQFDSHTRQRQGGTSSHAEPPPDFLTDERGGASGGAPRAKKGHTLPVLFAIGLLLFLLPLLIWRVYGDRPAQRHWAGQGPWLSEVSPAGQPAPFDLSRVTVPRREIRGGGPPKDGIPALTDPEVITAAEARYLAPHDRVIGFTAGDEARAYPLRILNHHEIVNDRVGSVPVVITYCPLCDSAAAFDRRTELGELEFGVSGLLYNSNVLLYDRGAETESLWSQVLAAGISGPAAGKTLRALPIELTSWEDWRRRYPQTTVLSLETGHLRNYDRNPYERYFAQPGLMFPVNRTDDRLPAKEPVLGVWTENSARAYPASVFRQLQTGIEDELDGRRIVIGYNPEARSVRVVETDEGVQWMYSFWFAWYAMRPNTSIYSHR